MKMILKIYNDNSNDNDNKHDNAHGSGPTEFVKAWMGQVDPGDSEIYLRK